MSTVTRDDLLSSHVRRSIVDLVREAPARLAAADLAGRLDLHVTTVRFHLDQLEQAGVLLSQRERRESVGRPRKVYTVAEETVPVNEAAYVVLAGVLAQALQGGMSERSRASIAAGESWAQQHVTELDVAGVPGPNPPDLPVRELLDVLARWGYRRETVTVEQPNPGCYRLSLQSCPMREAALAHPEVVCAVHLGLIRGTLERLGLRGVGVRVRPMQADDLCLVELDAHRPGTRLDVPSTLPDPAAGDPVSSASGRPGGRTGTT